MSHKTLFIGALVIFTSLFNVESVLAIGNKKNVADAATLTQSSVQWQEFIAPEKTFKVLFPSKPAFISEKNPQENLIYNAYISEANKNEFYSIMLITMDDKANNSDRLNQALKKMISSNPHERVKKQTSSKFKNKDAVDFIIEADNRITQGKAFVEGRTLYILSTVASAENYNEEKFNYFVNSFNFLSPLSMKR